MLKINKFKEKILFEKARDVEHSEFGPELESHLSEMAITMYGSRGVGIAGPQIGDPRRILVADLGYVDGLDYGARLYKMVNPQILDSSDEIVKAEEGCLSYPGLAVSVERPESISVRFFSPAGEECNETFTGWQARIVMHEIDHLDGINLYSRSLPAAKRRYDKKMKKL